MDLFLEDTKALQRRTGPPRSRLIPWDHLPFRACCQKARRAKPWFSFFLSHSNSKDPAVWRPSSFPHPSILSCIHRMSVPPPSRSVMKFISSFQNPCPLNRSSQHGTPSTSSFFSLGKSFFVPLVVSGPSWCLHLVILYAILLFSVDDSSGPRTSPKLFFCRQAAETFFF